MTRPPASSRAASERMRRTGRRDTKCEMEVRRELHRQGFRYRVDRRVRGVSRSRPDIVFSREKIVVFVDGCFWHSCPKHATAPRANAAWWRAKLWQNVERDRRHVLEFARAGWRVLRYWEHEDPRQVADAIASVVVRHREKRGHDS